MVGESGLRTLEPAAMPALAQTVTTQAASWDLSALYPSDADWDKARRETLAALGQLAPYQGHLGDSADNLARALDAIPPELREDEKLKGLVAGVEATARELDSVFRKHGVEKFVSVGEPLDPNRHQAMVEIPHGEAEPGTIVQEMQSGYVIKDRLLRPALVGVARKPD